MDTGVPSVTTPGTLLMQAWCADSWDIPVIYPFLNRQTDQIDSQYKYVALLQTGRPSR